MQRINFAILQPFISSLLSFKNIAQAIGLKAIYQLLYIVFVLVTMKRLSIADYGTYSYIVAIILYFSAIPLIGLPLYLQRSIARGEILHSQYCVIPFLSMCSSLLIVYLILPPMGGLLKCQILIILCYNMLTAIIVAINDGRGIYTNQYKFLLLASLWMIICIFKTEVLHESLTIKNIIHYWMINAFLVLLLALAYSIYLSKFILKISHQKQQSYGFILGELLLLYSVNIPDSFAKFYDRYLANHYLDITFLGEYAFNSMIVLTLYAFFIRPINSYFISQFSKHSASVYNSAQLIKNYYIITLLIYSIVYLSYVPFAKLILTLLDLTKYQHTIYLFKFILANMILYLFAYPFVTLIAISGKAGTKIIYCIMSLLIFNLPLLLISMHADSQHFMIGFITAYSLNLLLVIWLARSYSFYFIKFYFKLCYVFFAGWGMRLIARYGK